MAGAFDFDDEPAKPAPRPKVEPLDDESPPQYRQRVPRGEADRGESTHAGKKALPPLVLGGIILGGLLVVGGAIALVLVLRTKDPETPKGSTPVVQGTSPRPGPPVPAKPVDLSSPTQETVERVKKATVRVIVAYKDGKTGSGSGFVEKDSRLVLTNAHVVGLKGDGEPGPRVINLVVNSGLGDKEYRLGGELLDVDIENDLAVIRPFILEIGERHFVPEGIVVPKNSNLVDLQSLFVFGFPLGDQLGAEISVRPTKVISLRKDPKSGKPSRIDVEGGMTFGNSGGPVVDIKGNVVGVAVAGLKSENIKFAIPSEKVLQLLARKRK